MHGYVLICPQSHTHLPPPRQDKDTASVHNYYTVYLHLFYPYWLQIEVRKSWGENDPKNISDMNFNFKKKTKA